MSTIRAAAPPKYDLDLRLLKHGDTFPQDAFYASTAPYVYFKAGRGTGKTTTLLFDAVDYAEEYQGSVQLFTEPSWQMIQRAALPLLDKLYGRVRGRTIEWTESPPVDIHVGGSLIWMAAADTIDENRLRGMNLARLLMDEGAQGHQRHAFDLASASVRDHRFPYLQRKVTSTPQGRNWLWDYFTANPLPGAVTFTAFTRDAEDCGFAPAGYTEMMAQQYGGWDNPLARQELMAQELEMAGQVFPQFHRDAHIRTLPFEWQDFKQRVGGIDFGGVSPTALVAGGLAGDGRAWAYGCWYRYQATLDDTAMAMEGLRQSHGIERWRADPSGKAEIEQLKRLGFNVAPALHHNSIELRVQLVGRRLNVDPATKLPGSYLTPDCVPLIAELEGLAWGRVRLAGRGEEQLRDAFERGLPDHAFDAWANCLSDFDQAREVGKRPQPLYW